jgi:hypothetical protein
MGLVMLGLFGLSEAVWVGIGTLVSLGVVILTGTMAFYTRKLAIETSALARETRDMVRSASEEREQVERHHRESLVPLLCAVGLETEVQVLSRSATDRTIIVRLTGTIQNIGPGPAATVEIWLAPFSYNAMKIRGTPIAGRGGGMKLSADYDVGPLFAGAASVGQAWCFKCVIRYTSLFGDEGWLMLSSGSGRAKDVKTSRERTIVGPMAESFEDALHRENLHLLDQELPATIGF